MNNATLSRVALGAIVMFAALAGISRAEAIRDAAGLEVVPRDASRIVSIGGAVTEILYALGQSGRIVAVDTTSLFPPEALKTKPNVGYFRQLSPEGVIGLAPSLIIAADGAGPREAVAVLETAAIPFVRVPDHFDGDGILEKIRVIAAATGTGKQAVCLENAVAKDLEVVAKLRLQVKRPARVMFILSFVNGRPMVAGRGTAADGIIRMSGAENVFGDFEGYKVVNDEAIVAAAPEVVLGMQRAGVELDAAQVFSQTAFRETPAAREKRFFAMEGLYMLGFGPRTARAARDLSLAIYPGLKGTDLPSEKNQQGKSPCQP